MSTSRMPAPLTTLAALVLLPLAVGALAGCRSQDALPSRSGPGRDIALPAETVLVRSVVPRNATLQAMLRAEGIADEIVARVIDEASSVFDLRRLRSLQPFSLVRTAAGGILRRLEYDIDAHSVLRVTVDDEEAGVVRAEVAPIPRTLEHVTGAGIIDATSPSLFQAMDAGGMEPPLAIALAEVFGGEVDFNNELQPGDRFALTFERFHREGRPVTHGEITAAELHNDGRVFRAVRFTPPGGKPAFYDEDGRSLRRFFLRSPLKFEPRITSRFSRSRMHPVLHVARAHRGVDYGAPHGAPVVAVASGTVVSASYDRANGRMVRLRHASGYQSFYLHLSAFATGIRAGTRITQGQTIGYVGATGLATGPHLHYGLQKNGVFVDPLREHRNMPPGEPVPEAAMPSFIAARDEAFGELDTAIEATTEDVVALASR